MKLIVNGSKPEVFRRDTVEVIRRGAVGLVLFGIVMAALSFKAHAQQRLLTTQPVPKAICEACEVVEMKTGRVDERKEGPVAEEEDTKAPESNAITSPTVAGAVPQETPSPTSQTQSPDSRWHYGGFVDVGYLLDFNHPANRIFRSRGTTWHVDHPHINGAAIYLKKKADEQSRWGVELTAQAGKDVELFGFSATAPDIGGFKFLRHLGPTNVSYFAPVGKGLTIQGGIFSSFIGYDSLYAKDNFNYTRPWGADFTPYFMLGVNASYPFTKRVTGTFFVVNGYWHLAPMDN